MIVFDKHWFKEHQKQILKAVNSPVGWLIRRSLWIDDKKNPVVKVTPESVHVLLPDGQVKTTIYSNKQYAEALHRNYKPIWETLHGWDMKFANRYMPAWNAGFDTYSSQPNETSGVDTFIIEAAPTLNLETDVELGIGERNDLVYRMRTLIKFDLSSISSSNTTSSNVLSVWIARDFSSNARTADAHRILRNWVENAATWNQWSSGNNWTTAGCGSDGNDADLSVSLGTCSFSATESVGTEKQFTLTNSEMDKFINGTYSNYGFLLKMQTESNDGYYVDSSSGATSSIRPKLVITHSAPTTSSQVIWFS